MCNIYELYICAIYILLKVGFTTVDSYFCLYCCWFLLHSCIVFYGVDYILHLICVTMATCLCLMPIFPVPIILNLLAKLVLSIVILCDLIRQLCLLDD